MQRQVFISHAAEDEDWPQDDVEAVAEAIRSAGITVYLDLWHLRERKRKLSLDEWRAWMDDALRQSTHVLCLVSPRYQQLWQRRPEDAGGFGIAFEAMRLIHTLYLRKQRGNGRILTLRRDARDHDCIPEDLILDCPEYRWAAECELLLSHLAHADLPASVLPQDTSAPSPAPAPAPVILTPPLVSPHPAPTVSPAQHQRPSPAWARASGRDEYGQWADLTINGETQRMRWIPPTGPEGFWMGSPAAERAAIQPAMSRDWANKTEHVPQREHLRMGFWLADTPCTQAFCRTVADIDPSHFSSGLDAPQRPVESVSWDFVMEQFIARLAAHSTWGLGELVCLPTEVEWEYAARAGTRTAYWWGDLWDAQLANGYSRARFARESTTPVKTYPPNFWGLYDIHGNVQEWCEDVWRERRGAFETRLESEMRVVRGGSFSTMHGNARSAFRGTGQRRDAALTRGFRFALIESSVTKDTTKVWPVASTRR